MIKKIDVFKNEQNKLYTLFYAFLTATFFSAFIYLEHYFGISIKLFNTLFALLALAMFLYGSKKAILLSGFLIGLIWFYWIGYSFEYQGVGYMTPIIIVAFAFIYMLFFGVLALNEQVFIRAILLFVLSFFEPFDWNWMQIELLFIESYIGIEKYHLVLVLLALTLPKYINNKFKLAPLIILILAFNYSSPNQEESKLNIKLVATDIQQQDKWNRAYLQRTIDLIYKEIRTAINEQYDVIVLPESVFPLYLNKNPHIIRDLQAFSNEIAIVTGALLRENEQTFNVSYIFTDGNYQVAKKMVLVPFGEYIPLPKFAQKIINDAFFSGQSDFINAKEPTDFTIKGEKFRNAICYEATCQEIYEGNVSKVIVISNNAWFAPSIEPTIQNLLIRYYARKNGAIIYHSANYKGTGIIK